MLLLPNLGMRKSSVKERLTRLEDTNPSSRSDSRTGVLMIGASGGL